MQFPLHTPSVQELPEVESQLQLKNVIKKQKKKNLENQNYIQITVY